MSSFSELPEANNMACGNDSDVNLSSGISHLPLTVLDALFPGFSLLASFLLGFGLDISVFVSWITVLAVAWTAIRYALIPACETLVKILSSFVLIEEYDPIYHQVLSWAAAQKLFRDIRSLRAQTAGRYYMDSESEMDEDDEEEESGSDKQHSQHLLEDMIFNFTSWSARVPPRYRPHSSTGWFLHDYRLFRLNRRHDRVTSDMGAVYDKERLEISVLWCSTKPIKDLIEEAREFHLARRTTTTTILRPTPKSNRSSRQQAWTTLADRPSRSIATVVLDDNQKATILKDLNDFLHPRTARWYGNRGIPHRRGYLFHGPPGTGKTSLSYALAGVFGLNIYSLSLSEATLTEEDLIILFNSLPKRCILLLEDVDTAGLVRSIQLKEAQDQQSKKTSRRKRKNQASESNVSKTGNHNRSTTARITGPDKNTLTLSGLLNAIDGVASQEGRVLIMTTNHPERLDPALTRPGRVDLSIAFDLATKQQIKDLFLSMYSSDTVEMTRQPTKISQILETLNAEKKSDDDTATTAATTTASSSSGPPGSTETCLLDLASTFANTFPERVFSPADIQGYLLMRKRDPAYAVAGVAEWRDEQLAKKAVTATTTTTTTLTMTMHADKTTSAASDAIADKERAVVDVAPAPASAAPAPVAVKHLDGSDASGIEFSTNSSSGDISGPGSGGTSDSEDDSAGGGGGDDYDDAGAESDSDEEL